MRFDTLSGSLLALTLALLPALEAPAAPLTPEAIRERARQVVARGRYQDSLGDVTGEERAGTRRSSMPSPPREPVLETPPALGTLAQMTLYVLLGVAVILIGFWIATVMGDRAPPREKPEKRAPRGAAGPRPESKELPGGSQKEHDGFLRRAGELAAAGRHDEAVHVLLLGAIRALSLELGAPLISLTSRELSGHFPLDDARRSAFLDLVATVERSFFGARSPDSAAYEACRARTESCFAGGGG